MVVRTRAGHFRDASIRFLRVRHCCFGSLRRRSFFGAPRQSLPLQDLPVRLIDISLSVVFPRIGGQWTSNFKPARWPTPWRQTERKTTLALPDRRGSEGETPRMRTWWVGVCALWHVRTQCAQTFAKLDEVKQGKSRLDQLEVGVVVVAAVVAVVAAALLVTGGQWWQ